MDVTLRSTVGREAEVPRNRTFKTIAQYIRPVQAYTAKLKTFDF